MNDHKAFSLTRHSRRGFLKKSSLGILSVSLVPQIFPLFRNLQNKVVVVRHKNVIGRDGHAHQNLVNEMVNRGIAELTGSKTLSTAWRHFFTHEDIIGMKINAINFRGYTGSPLASHYPIVCQSIISSCEEAGIMEKQFVIWDRQERELTEAGLKISNNSRKLRVMGTNSAGQDGKIGFHPESFQIGGKSTHVTRIMTDICTAAINVPVIKLHGLAGITISLKNHYGTIDNPSEFHNNECTNPGIPELNALPLIRKKERLTIVDALQAIYKEGNRWRQDIVWPYGGVILGTDPVAVDRICLEILNEKRIMEGEPPLNQKVKHLELSEKIGIGTANLASIKRVDIEIS